MEERRVSGIVFFDEKKRILLQDRCGISKRGEEWGFFGGHLENNETPEEAMLREVREELDFELKDSYRFIGEFHFQHPELRVIEYVFVAPIKNNLKLFTVKEGAGMRLLSIPEARKLKMFPGDYKILDALEKVI
jgi:8-oxo-dGTP diphosphatase